jgi:hypothetical protein
MMNDEVKQETESRSQESGENKKSVNVVSAFSFWLLDSEF